VKVTKMFLARRRLGMTQVQLAELIGVTQPRISAWENGHVEIPRGRRKQIAALLYLATDELDQEA